MIETKELDLTHTSTNDSDVMQMLFALSKASGKTILGTFKVNYEADETEVVIEAEDGTPISEIAKLL